MKCIIDGAYGFNNVGDEAMLNTAYKTLKEIHPNIDIVVSSYAPHRITELHGLQSSNGLLPGTFIRNCINFNIKSLKEQFHFARKIDVLLFAGGSILNDTKGIRNILVILFKVLLSIPFNYKIIFWGVSVNSPSSLIGSIIIKYIIRMSDLIILRDEASYNLAKVMSPNNDIKLGVDILFSLKLPDDILVSDVKKSVTRIGISLRPYPPILNVNSARYDDLLVEQFIYLTEKLSLLENIVFVPLVFSEGNQYQDDVALLERVIKDSKNTCFESIHYKISDIRDGSYSDYLNKLLVKYRSLDLVIGERFHSLIISQLLSIPYIGLSYDPKIKGLAKLSNVDDCIVDLVSGLEDKNLNEKVLSIYDFVYDKKNIIKSSLNTILNISKDDREYLKRIIN